MKNATPRAASAGFPNTRLLVSAWNLSWGASTDGWSDPNRPMSSAAAPASNLCTSERPSSSSSSSSSSAWPGRRCGGAGLPSRLPASRLMTLEPLVWRALASRKWSTAKSQAATTPSDSLVHVLTAPWWSLDALPHSAHACCSSGLQNLLPPWCAAASLLQCVHVKAASRPNQLEQYIFPALLFACALSCPPHVVHAKSVGSKQLSDGPTCLLLSSPHLTQRVLPESETMVALVLEKQKHEVSTSSTSFVACLKTCPFSASFPARAMSMMRPWACSSAFTPPRSAANMVGVAGGSKVLASRGVPERRHPSPSFLALLIASCSGFCGPLGSCVMISERAGLRCARRHPLVRMPRAWHAASTALTPLGVMVGRAVSHGATSSVTHQTTSRTARVLAGSGRGLRRPARTSRRASRRGSRTPTGSEATSSSISPSSCARINPMVSISTPSALNTAAVSLLLASSSPTSSRSQSPTSCPGLIAAATALRDARTDRRAWRSSGTCTARPSGSPASCRRRQRCSSVCARALTGTRTPLRRRIIAKSKASAGWKPTAQNQGTRSFSRRAFSVAAFCAAAFAAAAFASLSLAACSAAAFAAAALSAAAFSEAALSAAALSATAFAAAATPSGERALHWRHAPSSYS
mmetsp:Transcript_66784/g.159704  ORF Transcript_66784/g.159704 Transcript_66784/m.159704 type:complete len:637 (+) Transcript_66784:382-2292(+)